MTSIQFKKIFLEFIKYLQSYAVSANKDWKIKGFIDADKNIFTISTDTKLVSKILELHLLPQIAKFAQQNGFYLIVPDSQNYYPDLTFELKSNPKIKYAVDIKTTFMRGNEIKDCKFTLGSHGSYFIDRNSRKNIQYPYNKYKGHFVLGIIYKKIEKNDEKTCYKLTELDKIISVINNLKFFFIEKWKIATDNQGSGNTANIGGLLRTEKDMIDGNDVFNDEDEFDDFWMNYKKITVLDKHGKAKQISKLSEFRAYRGKCK